MLRINQLKVLPGASKEELLQKACKLLHITPDKIREFHILRTSIDARHKPEIFISHTLQVSLYDANLEKKILKNANPSYVSLETENPYAFPAYGRAVLRNRPVIIGMGPAGLFCGYYLAIHGYRPIILEQGKDVDHRTADVEHFWKTGELNEQSNVQFGEGGAGTFSDGKLNTLVKDKYGRNREVLRTLVKFGAPEDILYSFKPHIGTDLLTLVVKNMREAILAAGGEIRFETKMTSIDVKDNRICALQLADGSTLPCDQLVLAIGHSARDTFSMLYEKALPMETKPFAVGMRVEHPQRMITESQYGDPDSPLGAAPYKVTSSTSSGRGVYSFCMCPGGYVVNASSEKGHLAVNGMSYHGRNGANANSAIIVSVTPQDYGSEHPLAGIAFQRDLEQKAYALCQGAIPYQRFGTYKACIENQCTLKDLADSQRSVPVEEGFEPCMKGLHSEADLSSLLPAECGKAFVEGMEQFGRQIKGFDRMDAILSGIESRTSSPVRMVRDNETLQSTIEGIYPCGEGAGYAGGITSAAMDGIKVAEALAGVFAPF